VATVPETKFFEVTSSLKSAFDNTDTPFSLFSSNTELATHDDDDDDDYDSAVEDAGEWDILSPFYGRFHVNLS